MSDHSGAMITIRLFMPLPFMLQLQILMQLAVLMLMQRRILLVRLLIVIKTLSMRMVMLIIASISMVNTFFCGGVYAANSYFTHVRFRAGPMFKISPA